MNCAAALSLVLVSCDRRPEISVADVWARETASGQSAAAVYLTIANSGAGGDRLVAAGSPAARSAGLHSSSSSGGVARMRALPDGLELPARSRVDLKPGGTHVMLTGLKRPIAAGGTVELSLRFERSAERTISVRVLPASAVGPDSGRGMAM